MSFQTIRRGGPYFRVADPFWEDPLEGLYSQVHGGRWNPSGSFPVVCRSAAAGAAQDDEKLAWFQRSRALRRLGVRKFEDWFWPE